MPRSAEKREAGISEAGALVASVRTILPEAGRTEQRMFGGIGFMIDGNMVAGASQRGLLLRVGKANHAAALAQPGIRAMEMRGRPVEGYVVLDPAAVDKKRLRDWLTLALGYVRTLPPKPPKSKRKGART